MSTLQAARPTLDAPDADISARSFWAQDFERRDATFARFRAECPVSWHRPYESELMPPDEDTAGFWSVTVIVMLLSPPAVCGDGVMSWVLAWVAPGDTTGEPHAGVGRVRLRGKPTVTA